MTTLEKLPSLIKLKLQYNAYRGKELVCTVKGFPQLQMLRLLDLDELDEIKVAEGALPSFRHLEIWQCMKLKMVPTRLRSVPTLQKLVFGKMPREFEDRVRGDDEDKLFKIRYQMQLLEIQHIPPF
ncbi:Disease resistance protein [Thalictrum thalictroides]|uniref:Disease resistance protein n=1 Tax=Thalictrum thalictroides TaxID=46969 RepID=A0A7J6WT12_THATH|nr:Disease resistance protein [Thalictrum thalictroides]